MTVEVTVEPDGCICPSQSYTCRADLATEIQWDSSGLPDDIAYDIRRQQRIGVVEESGIKVEFSEVAVAEESANLTSQLFIIDLYTWNESSFTCQENPDEDGPIVSVDICVTGPASAPTDLSVVWDSSSAVVSFQPPEYGGECVDHYVVTATSEDGNVTCDAENLLTHKCNVAPGGNISFFNFIVYSVTVGADGATYRGIMATDCCLPYPENVRASEEKCELQHLVSISWKRNALTPANATITWHRVYSSEDIHSKRASSEGFYLLKLENPRTGQLKIGVTFSSVVCSKTTVVHYLVEGVLKSVSLNSTTLVIESRDCIASPENYRIVATSTEPLPVTELVNVSFSPVIEHDVGDVVMPNTQYSIRVVVVHTSSGTIINERNTTIMYNTTTTEPSEPGVTEAVQPTTDVETAYIAVGAALGVGVMLLVTGMVVVLCGVRKYRRKHGMYNSTVGLQVTTHRVTIADSECAWVSRLALIYIMLL
jgi:hypothetical protein